ncbi:hypothetical protein D3C80_1142790 [compost metagenome]
MQILLMPLLNSNLAILNLISTWLKISRAHNTKEMVFIEMEIMQITLKAKVKKLTLKTLDLKEV